MTTLKILLDNFVDAGWMQYSMDYVGMPGRADGPLTFRYIQSVPKNHKTPANDDGIPHLTAQQDTKVTVIVAKFELRFLLSGTQ